MRFDTFDPMATNLSMAISRAIDTGAGFGSSTNHPDLAARCDEFRWYAAYTSANHEKRVAEQLGSRAVEHFLPVYASVRRWKDRRVTLQLPLFPGYVFVRMELRNRLQVLQIPGLARLVGFGASPVALPQDEIDALRTGLTAGLRAAPHPYLNVGRRARIKQGPLAGLEGILLRWKGNWRVVLSLDLIQRSVAVDVDASALEAAVG
ncbi:MAG TPA: UpxY family transcription antiterminator [Candidatus Acidoferrales bacterium]|nr:UpxY family transcription antiterminator [Candidatus Acidoferrales bacterium]